MIWRTIHADDGDWEVRVFATEPDRDHYREEILEFRPTEPTKPPRQLSIGRTRLNEMNDDELHSAFVRARPIGGDYYGRPGKRMSDVPVERLYTREL